jgi:hypothetical protein
MSESGQCQEELSVSETIAPPPSRGSYERSGSENRDILEDNEAEQSGS